ncbi:hypothetical protein GALL_317280 [mine drainage metagenome]|uniref:Cytochrome b561 bacterial/Ni-hydrogenase domain-containing protein n=1 Tax=mine drainage metagenome TaxID=410659 RepID=A0A1J5QSI1_9ZZZZ
MNRPQQSYSAPTRFFHWAILILLLIEFPIAWTMPDVRRDTLPHGLIAWHIFFGTLILAAMLLRVLWRASRKAPPELPMPKWQAVAAKLTHGLLYLGFIVLPLLGWMNASSRGWDVKLLGFIPLFALFPSGSSWGHEMGDVHQAVAIGLLVLIGLHVLAAAYHEMVLRDGTMRRILVSWKR